MLMSRNDVSRPTCGSFCSRVFLVSVLFNCLYSGSKIIHFYYYNAFYNILLVWNNFVNTLLPLLSRPRFFMKKVLLKVVIIFNVGVDRNLFI